MNKNSNLYIFLYTTICVILVVLLLTLASVGLQPYQKANRQCEMMGQILTASGISVEKEKIIDFFDKNVEEISFLDSLQQNRTLYCVQLNNQPPIYVIRMEGKGLWGKIWGYIAIENDGSHVCGVVFDHKSETPGLGGEITTRKFTDPFKGKLLFDTNGNFVGIKVVKGGVANSAVAPEYGVDAITGGTITSKGVEEMLFYSLLPYISFLKELHK